MKLESEVTLLDGVDYCEVHGHNIFDLTVWYVIDIIGTLQKETHCLRCGKTHYIRKSSHKQFIQESEEIYYNGWDHS